MKELPDLADIEPQVLDQLRAYTALDNPIRLRAYLLIRDSPEIAFSVIARELVLETGLLAYHLGVLKAANLVEMNYSRSGREITRYRLAARGEEVYAALFPRRRRSSKKARKAVVRPLVAR